MLLILADAATTLGKMNKTTSIAGYTTSKTTFKKTTPPAKLNVTYPEIFTKLNASSSKATGTDLFSKYTTTKQVTKKASSSSPIRSSTLTTLEPKTKYNVTSQKTLATKVKNITSLISLNGTSPSPSVNLTSNATTHKLSYSSVMLNATTSTITSKLGLSLPDVNITASSTGLKTNFTTSTIHIGTTNITTQPGYTFNVSQNETIQIYTTKLSHTEKINYTTSIVSNLTTTAIRINETSQANATTLPKYNLTDVLVEYNMTTKLTKLNLTSQFNTNKTTLNQTTPLSFPTKNYTFLPEYKSTRISTANLTTTPFAVTDIFSTEAPVKLNQTFGVNITEHTIRGNLSTLESQYSYITPVLNITDSTTKFGDSINKTSITKSTMPAKTSSKTLPVLSNTTATSTFPKNITTHFHNITTQFYSTPSTYKVPSYTTQNFTKYLYGYTTIKQLNKTTISKPAKNVTTIPQTHKTTLIYSKHSELQNFTTIREVNTTTMTNISTPTLYTQYISTKPYIDFFSQNTTVKSPYSTTEVKSRLPASVTKKFQTFPSNYSSMLPTNITYKNASETTIEHTSPTGKHTTKFTPKTISRLSSKVTPLMNLTTEPTISTNKTSYVNMTRISTTISTLPVTSSKTTQFELIIPTKEPFSLSKKISDLKQTINRKKQLYDKYRKVLDSIYKLIAAIRRKSGKSVRFRIDNEFNVREMKHKRDVRQTPNLNLTSLCDANNKNSVNRSPGVMITQVLNKTFQAVVEKNEERLVCLNNLLESITDVILSDEELILEDTLDSIECIAEQQMFSITTALQNTTHEVQSAIMKIKTLQNLIGLGMNNQFFVLMTKRRIFRWFFQHTLDLLFKRGKFYVANHLPVVMF